MKWQHGESNKTRSFLQDLFGLLKIAIPIMLVVSISLIAIYREVQRVRENRLIEELVKQESTYVEITSQAVEKNIAAMARELLIYKDFTTRQIQTGTIDEIAYFYLNIANNSSSFDQLRYIDEQGMEKVRVNLVGNKGILIPSQDLQNKQDRYYFQNSYKLESGQIYISPLDLNVENGEIEIPYKPMIRLATPVFDSKGNNRGIVILNYLAKDLLSIIETVYREYEANLSLVNQEGYFLIHEEDRDKEFGFMFANGHQNKLNLISPEIYQQAEEKEIGWYKNEEGLFTFTRIYPFKGTWSTSIEDNTIEDPINNRFWIIITHIPHTMIDQRLLEMRAFSKVGVVLILFLALATAMLFAVFLYQKISEDRFLKNLAHFDQLTRCFTRGWGFKLLQEVIVKAKKRKVKVALLFIDLDKFKSVNDTYGHKAGDAVLVAAAERIKEVLRSDDIIVRLGGDEFLVILPIVLDDTVPTEVASRIHQAIQEPIPFGTLSLKIDSSIGIAMYPTDGIHINDLVSYSDSAMYEAKMKKKDSYHDANLPH